MPPAHQRDIAEARAVAAARQQPRGHPAGGFQAEQRSAGQRNGMHKAVVADHPRRAAPNIQGGRRAAGEVQHRRTRGPVRILRNANPERRKVECQDPVSGIGPNRQAAVIIGLRETFAVRGHGVGISRSLQILSAMNLFNSRCLGTEDSVRLECQARWLLECCRALLAAFSPAYWPPGNSSTNPMYPSGTFKKTARQRHSGILQSVCFTRLPPLPHRRNRHSNVERCRRPRRPFSAGTESGGTACGRRWTAAYWR